VIPDEVISFNILFIIFIFYGIILLEEPSILLLITGIGAIVALLIKSTGQEIQSASLRYWVVRLETILPITYFALLGLRLVGDTLAEKRQVYHFESYDEALEFLTAEQSDDKTMVTTN